MTPKDIFGGPDGAIAKIRALQAWFESQRSLLFFAASILVIYEVRLKMCRSPPMSFSTPRNPSGLHYRLATNRCSTRSRVPAFAGAPATAHLSLGFLSCGTYLPVGFAH